MTLQRHSSLQAAVEMPSAAPLAMPIRPLDAEPAVRQPPAPPGLAARRLGTALATAVLLGTLVWAMARGLGRDGFGGLDWLILSLFAFNAFWIAFAAATATAGLLWADLGRRAPRATADWRPNGRTAVLIPARNENVAELAARVGALARDLDARGLAADVDLFVLSDSDDPRAIIAEERLARAFAADRLGPRRYYRRRLTNAGRKPGNIADWVRRWGAAYAYMLVLDADSVMSARRIGALVRRMETRPRLALIQTGIRLVGAETRFGRLQQVAGRLYGGVFARGMAGWAGNAANFYGHNALIRVRAFAEAAGMPRLSGPAPLGGDLLSHDFVEAAWLRRAGWAVEFDPDSRGSAEGGPQTMAVYHKRDRRWCQGNLQHLRLLSARGLHPVSRLHFLGGVAGYAAAPVWLALVLLAIVAGPGEGMFLPALGVLALILATKAAGVAGWLRRRNTPRTRRIVLHAAAYELALSTLIAPTMMMRHSVAVLSVLAGQDCGWKPAGGATRSGDSPWLEPLAGSALLIAAVPGGDDLWQLALIAPIALPLLVAPLISAWLDLPEGAPLVERRAAARPAAPLYAVQR